MTDMPIYHASELNPDTCLEIAMFLFETPPEQRTDNYGSGSAERTCRQ